MLWHDHFPISKAMTSHADVLVVLHYAARCECGSVAQ